MVAWKSTTDFKMNTILIISQNREGIAVWESLFKQKSCLVVSEGTPHDALQTCKLLSPSLIILDLDLPQQEHIELCRSLRAVTSGALLLLSPSDSIPNVFEYYHAGVDEHLSTPISPMVLLVKSMAWLVKQEANTSYLYKS
jgi:CheY-like chemotaxis protein